MPPFSRLQLAAALIEYDNDLDDPDAPYRSAEQSAIFSFLRNKPDPRSTIMGYDEMPRKSTDFLGVTLPGETGEPQMSETLPVAKGNVPNTQRAPEAPVGGRKTPDGRRSVEMLTRPSSEIARLNGQMFQGADDDEEEEENELGNGPELNLASWGVDEFLTKDKPKPRSRANSVNAYDRVASPGPSIRPRLESTTSSNGLANQALGERGANRRSAGYRANSAGDWAEDFQDRESYRQRPNSMVDPADIAMDQAPPTSFRRRSGSLSAMHVFPSSTTPEGEPTTPNPFEIPLPAEAGTSRFDPKALAHQRTISFASMSTRQVLMDGGDVQDHHSNYNDNASIMTDSRRLDTPHRYSRNDLLRPKVLIMPSPLQDRVVVPVKPKRPVREGFEDTTDARPLPPGAKTGERTSTFGINPRHSMSLAQLTFRNSLMVGGQRDPSYADIEGRLRRAEHEGEMIIQEVDPEPELETEAGAANRPAGKLFGRSLIDDLESRKAALKNKQRVFRGDERPSMMQRVQPIRSSTLIDAQDLHISAQGPSRPDLHRNPSSQEPLLDFGNEPVPGTNVRSRPQIGRSGSGLPQSRSVFGVDQVWEKELVKLKQIEALEMAEEEERKRFEDEKKAKEDARAAKKAAKKGKNRTQSIDNLNNFAVQGEAAGAEASIVSPIAKTPVAPPLLPEVNPFPVPARKEEASSDSDSDDDVDPRRQQDRMRRSHSRQEWLSDDERQATRRPSQPQLSKFAAGLHIDNDDSDEDVPLTAALAKAKQKQEIEDSDEDKPLADVLNKSMSMFDFGGTLLADVVKPQEAPRTLKPPRANSDDEDDKPLGLQHPNSRFSRAPANDESDDEQPLGMRFSAAPSQLFAAQQQSMIQQQMMQQQMMAAQMRNTMFNPMMVPTMPMMGMGMNMNMNMGFGNPMDVTGMNPGMMHMAPMGMVEQAAPIDAAKYGRVDRWRHDVGSATEA
ncbi:hypothetical protein CPB86DRAFT_695217 [Serendipita vermifera]|nr:hypothetical protein CPB86DRAFT_695217 [Serendipita vermifera]